MTDAKLTEVNLAGDYLADVHLIDVTLAVGKIPDFIM